MTITYTVITNSDLVGQVTLTDNGVAVTGSANGTTGKNYTVTVGHTIVVTMPTWFMASVNCYHSITGSSSADTVSVSIVGSSTVFTFTAAVATVLTVTIVTCNAFTCPECGSIEFVDESNGVSYSGFILVINSVYICALCGYDDSMLQHFIGE
jgi:hypothetical protein